VTGSKLGVDFGGTRIKAGRVEGARVEGLESCPTPKGGPSAVFDAITELLSALDREPAAVGVAIPGEVDGEGRIYRLPNVPGFEGVPIGPELSARLGCRVVIENDSTCAALGELVAGHGREHRSFLVATLGTGVGGGLVVEKKLRRGRFGFAAEVGHILIDSSSDAWPCGCGRTGCMEAYAGTRGLLRDYAERGGKAQEPRDVFLAARRGEVEARATVARVGRALGTGLAQAQKVLDLDALVFAGGISASFDLLEAELRAALTQHVHGPPTGTIPLLVSELGNEAGVLGAGHLPSL
jgi:glucokinase